jgi:hypothetical protein
MARHVVSEDAALPARVALPEPLHALALVRVQPLAQAGAEHEAARQQWA